MDQSENALKSLMKLSTKAFKKGEIPVAAIVIKDNKILSKKYNLKEKRKDITAHAEILAIQKAARKLKSWNLTNCDLYVTLKPCKMCEEVIKQSRIRNVYYILDKLDYKHDYNKTNFNLLNVEDELNSYQQLLSSFFKKRRL